LKKDRGPSAGDIFLRPPEELERDDDDFETPAYISEEYASIYKKYTVTRKMPMVGRQERGFSIDGDFIYIMPPENRNLFDNVRTISVHISNIVSCKQVKKSSPMFKLVCLKDRDTKTFEFEAATVQEAVEICTKIHFMTQFTKGNMSRPTLK
jgi:hypothetical protein